jgi:hypothetical protein
MPEFTLQVFISILPFPAIHFFLKGKFLWVKVYRARDFLSSRRPLIHARIHDINTNFENTGIFWRKSGAYSALKQKPTISSKLSLHERPFKLNTVKAADYFKGLLYDFSIFNKSN